MRGLEIGPDLDKVREPEEERELGLDGEKDTVLRLEIGLELVGSRDLEVNVVLRTSLEFEASTEVLVEIDTGLT